MMSLIYEGFDAKVQACQLFWVKISFFLLQMWEEWWRAAGRFPKLVHEKWGAENVVDISRNLSRFAKPRRTFDQPLVSAEAELPRKEASINRKPVDGEASELLIDENEVLRVLFQKVNDPGSDSEDDDDEMDNIYSKLEVRQERKPEAEGHVINTSGREACGYCERVCFCSPGHRNVTPYVPVSSQAKKTDSVSLLGACLLRPEGFREEAMNALAKLMAAKLEGHNTGFSGPVITNKFAIRAEKLTSSISEAYEFANEVKANNCKWKNALKPVWSSDQAKELLQMEVKKYLRLLKLCPKSSDPLVYKD